MKALYDIKEMLCEELEQIGKKQEMSAGDLEAVHKLTDTIKNIDKICMLEEGGYSQDGYSRDGYSRSGYSQDGYSQGGRWAAEGEYSRGNSYRGRHWVRGHYSRDDGHSMRRGYSRADGKEEMMRNLEERMQSASGRERETIEMCMEMLGR